MKNLTLSKSRNKPGKSEFRKQSSRQKQNAHQINTTPGWPSFTTLPSIQYHQLSLVILCPSRESKSSVLFQYTSTCLLDFNLDKYECKCNFVYSFKRRGSKIREGAVTLLDSLMLIVFNTSEALCYSNYDYGRQLMLYAF